MIFVAGIALGSFFDVPMILAYAVFLFCLVTLVVFWQKRHLRILASVFLTIILGFIRVQICEKDAPKKLIDDLSGRTMDFKGLVIEEPESGEMYQKIKVAADIAQYHDIKILITHDLYPKHHYGDGLKISGKLVQPEDFEGFNYREYLKRFGIYLVAYKPEIESLSHDNGNRFMGVIYRIKSKFSDIAGQSMKEPESAIFQAMAFNIRSAIPDDVMDDYSKTGLTHIIAISGMNITIIAGIFMNLCLGIGFGRKQAFWCANFGLLVFLILIGLPASAVRAGIMGFLVLLAMYLGRLNRAVNAFVFAGAVMLLADPKLLRHDVGFQLSFLAVLGLIYIGPILERIFIKVPDILQVKSIVLMTLAAQFFTLPLIMVNFHRLSVISPVANILVVPFLSPILITGFVGTLVSLVFLPLGKILFWPCYLLMKYLTLTINFMADLKWSCLAISNINYPFLFILYLSTILFYKIIKRKFFRKPIYEEKR